MLCVDCFYSRFVRIRRNVFSGRLKVAIEITKLDPSWPVTKLRLTAILFRAFRAVFIDNPGASARA